MNKIGDYNRLFGLFGVLWTVLSLMVLFLEASVKVIWVPLYVFSIAIAISSVFYGIGHLGRNFNLDFLKGKISFAILTGHLIDASSSYIGIERLGYVGKHVVENLLIDYTDSAMVMYPLKIAILIPSLYILHKYFTDEEELGLKNLVLLTILVLGLAPGIRNTLRMALGV